MIKIIYSFFICSMLFSLKATSSQKEWVVLNEANPVKCEPVFSSSAINQSEVTFNLPGFFKEEKQTPQVKAFVISIPGGGKILQAGIPDLPQLAFSLSIPDDTEMIAVVSSSQYSDYHLPVAPSKGNLKRNIDPSQIPYTYSSVYSSNNFYPTEIVRSKTDRT